MKKIIIIFLIIIFIIVIFGGWFLFSSKEREDKQKIKKMVDFQDISCEDRGKIYKKDRESLYPKLQTAITFEECKDIIGRLIELGPLDCQMVVNTAVGSSESSEFCSCSDMYSYQELMSECLSSVALENNNYYLCSDSKQEVCQKEKELGSTQKTEACEYNFQNDCLLNYLAKVSEKNSLPNCADFPSDVLRFFCLEELAIIKNDWHICLDIDKQNYQNKCLYYLALKNRDNSLCHKIKNNNDYIDKIKECKEKVDIYGDPKNKPEDYNNMFDYAVLNKESSLCPKFVEWDQSHDKYCELLIK